MSEPDITKKKKGKKRRSARVYVNANKPLAVPLDEIAAHFPADDDDDGPTPAHTEAAARTRKAATGMPADPYAGHPFADRVSPPLGPGHAAYGVGDHGAARGTTDPMNQPGPKALALGHPDMRQGTTHPVPLFTMTTVNGDNAAGDRDIIFGAGRVSVSRLDAAAATGLSSAPGNPASRRMDHIAPTSATPPNGGHGLADPQSHAGAMKSSEAKAYLAAEHRRQMGQ